MILSGRGTIQKGTQWDQRAHMSDKCLRGCAAVPGCAGNDQDDCGFQKRTTASDETVVVPKRGAAPYERANMAGRRGESNVQRKCQTGRVSGPQTITKNGPTVVVAISLRFLPKVVARFFIAIR
jgi:hypothetical protein